MYCLTKAVESLGMNNISSTPSFLTIQVRGLVLFTEVVCNKAMTKIISQDALLKYIKCEQIAFQFGDGLMSFTQTCDTDEMEELTTFISNSSKIKNVSSCDIITDDDKYGFNEFARWSQNNDLLLLIDESLLLCLPASVNLKES